MTNKQKTLKEVLEETRQIGIFNGTFDAKNGSWEFMHGVACVMEFLAYQVSEEYFEELQKEFYKNFEKSLDKVKEKSYTQEIEGWTEEDDSFEEWLCCCDGVEII